MIMVGKRARQYEINESAGDILIIKAVILAPNYLPSRVQHLTKVLKYEVHAIYNVCVWNVPTSQTSQGTKYKSHNDIVYQDHIDENKVIGYFVKEAGRVTEYELDPQARKFLTEDQIEEIEDELKKLKW